MATTSRSGRWQLAFELLTEGFEFDVERLYVTVYRGSEELGLPPDDISAAAWARAGIPRDHIVYLGDEDNFWSAGDTGPCGPCTEVFYDTGSEHGPQYHPAANSTPPAGTSRSWNAGVFMEFNRRPGGTLEPLRFSSVDTGSGLERMAMVLQGCDSVYETDLFRPIVAAARAALASGDPSPRDVRQIADHVRAAVLILGEGVAPSNEGRGYIPRRLLRTAIATATQAGADDFDLDQVARAALALLEPSYPVLASRREQVLDLLSRERRDFGRVVRRGLAQLNALAASPDFEISGEDAFTLVATHGLPADLIRDFAARRGGRVDERRFAELFAEHQQLSRPAARPGTGPDHAAVVIDPELIAAAGAGPTEFLGYRQLSGDGRVLALTEAREHAGPRGLAAELAAGERGLAVLDRTPFYAEGGGQVGDTGQLTGPGGAAAVLDTQSTDGASSTSSGHQREADRATWCGSRSIAAARRPCATTRPPTCCTPPLRQVLGDHVRQAGSLVAPDRLRFDFEHPSALTPGAADEVERLVNTRVLPTPGGPRGSCPSPRRSAAGPSRSSATTTARTCGWCRSAASRPSCAAAPTCRLPPRSGCSASSARAASARGYAGSRR